MLQVFAVHQQTAGVFPFSARLCGAVQLTAAVLTDLPLPTLALQATALTDPGKQRLAVSFKSMVAIGQDSPSILVKRI